MILAYEEQRTIAYLRSLSTIQPVVPRVVVPKVKVAEPVIPQPRKIITGPSSSYDSSPYPAGDYDLNDSSDHSFGNEDDYVINE